MRIPKSYAPTATPAKPRTLTVSRIEYRTGDCRQDITSIAARFGIGSRMLKAFWGITSVPIFTSMQAVDDYLRNASNSLAGNIAYCSSLETNLYGLDERSRYTRSCVAFFYALAQHAVAGDCVMRHIVAVERNDPQGIRTKEGLRFLHNGEAVGMITLEPPEHALDAAPRMTLAPPDFVAISRMEAGSKVKQAEQATDAGIAKIVEKLERKHRLVVRDVDWVILTQTPRHRLRRTAEEILRIPISKVIDTYSQAGHIGNLDYIAGLSVLQQKSEDKKPQTCLMIGAAELRDEFCFAGTLVHLNPTAQ